MASAGCARSPFTNRRTSARTMPKATSSATSTARPRAHNCSNHGSETRQPKAGGGGCEAEGEHPREPAEKPQHRRDDRESGNDVVGGLECLDHFFLIGLIDSRYFW